MSTTTLTADSFEETVTKNDIVLVDFWAEWCGPCRMFAPVFEQAAQGNPDIVFGKVDTEEERSLAAAANNRSTPTLMAIRETPAFLKASIASGVSSGVALGVTFVRSPILTL